MPAKTSLLPIVLLSALFAGHCSSTDTRDDSRFNYANVYNEKFGPTGKGGYINLTLEKGESYGGSITPDGKYLFFTSNRSGNYDIYMRALDDVAVIPVIQTATNQKEPAISPDGNYLAYIDDELDPDGDLFLAKVKPDAILKKFRKGEMPEVGKTVIITNNREKRIRSREMQPVWSPDSRYLAFSSDMTSMQGSQFGPGLGAEANIWILDKDAPEQALKITANGGVMPSFSPDGKKIIYISYANPEMNGDIFEVPVEGGKPRQISSGPHIDLNPSYSSDGQSIIFTRISQDTNGDGEIDRKDFGSIVRMDMPEESPDKSSVKAEEEEESEEDLKDTGTKTGFRENTASALTLNRQNIFDTRASSYMGGSILFALGLGEDINVTLLPENGIVPKRESIWQQYELSRSLKPETQDPDRNDLYLLSLEKVSEFFPEDDLHDLYQAMTIQDAEAFTGSRGGFSASADKKVRLLLQILGDLEAPPGDSRKKLITATDNEEYLRQLLDGNYLDIFKPQSLEKIRSSLNKNRNGKNGAETGEKGGSKELVDQKAGELREKQNRVHAMMRSTFMEKLALTLSAKGRKDDAIKIFRTILRENPFYYRTPDIFLETGRLSLDIDIPGEFKFLLHPDQDPYQLPKSGKKGAAEADAGKEAKLLEAWKTSVTAEAAFQAEKEIFRFFRESMVSRKNKQIDTLLGRYPEAKYPEFHYLNHLARADFFAEKNDTDNLSAALSKSEPLLPQQGYWRFLFHVLQGSREELSNNAPGAYGQYLAALKLYSPSFRHPGINTLISRTLQFYRSNAQAARNRGDFEAAWNEYHFLSETMLTLDALGMEKEIIQKQGQEIYPELNSLVFDRYRDDEDFAEKISAYYNERMDEARRYLNNSFIFGRAHLNAQLGILKHQDHESKGLSKSGKKEVLLLFKSAETDFKWSFFADPYFADSYVMLGWMYQFIDEKREVILDVKNRRKDKDIYYSLYEKFFPDYLFEKNIQLYQKSIAFFSDRISPRILASFYLNIGNNYFLLNNYVKAAEYFSFVADKEGEEFSFESQIQEASFFFHYGKSLYFTGDYRRSADYLERALDVYAKIAGLYTPQDYQFKREQILKYRALSEELDGDLDASIRLYEQILSEQINAGVNRDRSLIHLEMARLHLNRNQTEKSFSDLQSAEAALHSEPEILAPEFPLQVQWTTLGFIDNSLSWLLSKVYTMKYDDVYVGENRLVFSLPTLNRWQYLYSLRADVYRNGNLLIPCLGNLELLQLKASEDKSKHGLETLNTAQMRIGHLRYLMLDFPGAIASYEEAIKTAEKRVDLATQRRARQNILALTSQYVETVEMDGEGKRKYLEEEIAKLDKYQSDYIENSVKIADKALKSKNKNMDLKPDDISRITVQAGKEIYPQMIYRAIFRSYLSQIQLEEFQDREESYEEFLGRKKEILDSFNAVDKEYPGTYKDSEGKDLNYLEQITNRRFRLITDANRSFLRETLGILPLANKDLNDLREKSDEFQLVKPGLVINYRLALLQRLSGTGKEAVYISKCLEIISKSPWLLLQEPELTAKIYRKAVQYSDDAGKSLVLEHRRRIHGGLAKLIPLLNLPAQEVETEQNFPLDTLRSYLATFTAEKDADESIERIRLSRQKSIDQEAQKAGIRKTRAELEDVISRNPRGKALLRAFHTDISISADRALVIASYGDDTQFWIRNGDKVHSEKFKIPDDQVTAVITGLQSDQSLKDLQKNRSWLVWLAENKPEQVVFDLKFAQFPWSRFYKAEIMRSTDALSSEIMKNNRGLSRSRILQTVQSGGSGLLGFAGFGNSGSPVVYKTNLPALEVGTAADNSQWNANRNWAEILDYEFLLDFNGGLQNLTQISMAQQLHHERAPVTVILTYQSAEKIPARELLHLRTAGGIFFSAMGVSEIVQVATGRKNAEGELAVYLDRKVPVETSFIQNPELHRIVAAAMKKGGKENDKEDPKGEIPDLLPNLTGMETASLQAAALDFSENGDSDQALALADRAIHTNMWSTELRNRISGKKSKFAKDFPSHLFRNTLLFESGRISEGRIDAADYLEYLEKSGSKDGGAERKTEVWLNARINEMDFGTPETVLAEISSEAGRYSPDKKEWGQFADAYYRSALKSGNLILFTGKEHEFVRKSGWSFPEKYETRLEFLLGRSGFQKRWRNVLNQSLESGSALKLMSSDEKRSDREVLESLYLRDWLSRYDSDLPEIKTSGNLTGLKKFLDSKSSSWQGMEEAEFRHLQSLNEGLILLKNGRVSAAADAFRRALDRTDIRRSRVFTDSMIFGMLPHLDGNPTESGAAISFLRHAATVLSPEEKNAQRLLLYRMIGASELEKNPEELNKAVRETTSRMLANLNEMVYNRMLFYSARNAPVEAAGMSFFQSDKYAGDRERLKYFKLLQKQHLKSSKLIKPSTRTGMNFLVHYQMSRGDSLSALKIYFSFDQKIKLKEASPEGDLCGIFESFNGVYLEWSLSGGKAEISTTAEPKADFPSDLASRKPACVLYMPVRDNLLLTRKMNLLTDLSFTTYHRTGSEPSVQTDWSSSVPEGPLRNLLELQLTGKSAAKGFFRSSSDDTKGLNISGRILNPEKMREELEPGWNLRSFRRDNNGIYLTYLDIFLDESRRNKKAKLSDIAGKARGRLKEFYPLPEDYNSVKLIYQGKQEK